MNSSHESFLVPFFKEMNTEFRDKWCVLHSYETLPFYSVSDVDMAFSGTDVNALELLIKRIAQASKWVLLQKLWYDVQKCYYYVLLHAESNTLLAIDFLIDNDGIGRYGFTTKALTSDCVLINASFPVPNPEIAFSYKLIKRIIKQRSIKEDEVYLAEQYNNADHKKVDQILAQQFGEKGKERILTYLNDKTKTLGTNDIIVLHKLRKKTTSSIGNRLKYWIWELKRTFNRILYPCGMLISVPDMSEEQLAVFNKTLERKVGILFRFVRLNTSKSKATSFIGFVGSTLVICPKRNINWQKAIKSSWKSRKSLEIASTSCENDAEGLANLYFSEIIEVLAERMQKKQIANGN